LHGLLLESCVRLVSGAACAFRLYEMSKIVILRCLSRLSLQSSTFRTSLISAQAATQSLEGIKPRCEARKIKNEVVPALASWGNSLRSIPFVMSGHLIFNFFQTLGLPIFNTNPNNGCPKRIDQHSGQAHKHFSHRFHGVSFWTF